MIPRWDRWTRFTCCSGDGFGDRGSSRWRRLGASSKMWGMVKPGPRDPSEWRQLDEFELRERLRERRSEQDDADDTFAPSDAVAATAVPLAARDLDDVVIGDRPDTLLGPGDEDVPEPDAIGGAIGGILDVGAAAADMALTLAEQAAKTAAKSLEIGAEYTGRAAEKMGDFLVGSSPPEGGDGGGDGDGDGDGGDDSGNGTGGPTLGGGALEGGDFLSGSGSSLGGGHRSSEDGGEVFVDPAVVFEPNDEPVIAEQFDPIGDGGDGLVDDIG